MTYFHQLRNAQLLGVAECIQAKLKANLFCLTYCTIFGDIYVVPIETVTQLEKHNAPDGFFLIDISCLHRPAASEGVFQMSVKGFNLANIWPANSNGEWCTSLEAPGQLVKFANITDAVVHVLKSKGYE